MDYNKIKNKLEFNLNKHIQMIFKEQCDELNDLNTLKQTLSLDTANLNFNRQSDSLIEVFKNEQLLTKFNESIRLQWKSKVFEHTKSVYKSPESKNKYVTLNSHDINFSYERSLTPTSLENCIFRKSKTYDGFSLIFNSGMSSIISTLALSAKLLDAANNKKINCFLSVGYFETLIYLKKYFNLTNINFNDDYNNENIVDNDLYLLEPISVDLDLMEFQMDGFISKLKIHRGNKLKILIIDTSLQGNSFDINKILNELITVPNILIINVKSSLKMDQQGWELVNSGVISVYLNPQLLKLKEYIYTFLVEYRKLSSSSLSFEEVCLLDHQCFLRDSRYSNRILTNTADFFNYLEFKPNKTIKRIIYPHSDISQLDNKIPFLYLELHDNSEYKNQLFMKLLEQLLSNHGLTIPNRNSFGFRNITAEYFHISNSNSYVFKIAIGKLKGVTYFTLVEILNMIFNNDIYMMPINKGD